MIFRKPFQFKGKLWKPLDKSSEKVTYLKIDETADIIDQPNLQRIQFLQNLLNGKG